MLRGDADCVLERRRRGIVERDLDRLADQVVSFLLGHAAAERRENHVADHLSAREDQLTRVLLVAMAFAPMRTPALVRPLLSRGERALAAALISPPEA